MSAKGIEAVLGKAMSDSAFADQLLASPETALSGFDLTAEEIAKFSGMSRNDFSALSGMTPEERKSFMIPYTGNHNETALDVRR